MNKNLSNARPTITAVMISLNDEKIIEDCLKSIRQQDYPQHLIEIMIFDGGSTDNTVNIAQKYDTQIFRRPDLKELHGVRQGMALTSAKTDLMLFVSADNRLQENDVLSKMTLALEDKECVACATLRYGFNTGDPILSRYFALIGGADPIAVGLGKADRGPFDSNRWHGLGRATDCGFYYKVEFSTNTAKIPTLGGNGLLIKSELLKNNRYAKCGLHIDMCVDLILDEHNKFAFLKDQHVIHFLDLNLLTFLKRRLLYAKMYADDQTKRIYSVFHQDDFFKLLALVFFNLTLLIPLLRAIKGYAHKRDKAWFLHPIISFVFTVGYSFFFVKKALMRTKLK